MGFTDKIVATAKQLKEQFYTKPFALANGAQEDGTKKPYASEWLFSANLGIPRRTNVRELREFAKSSWVQMVLNTIKKEISHIDWDLPNKNEEDEEKYDEQKERVKEFFDYINSDGEDLLDQILPMLNDVGVVDSGVWVKVFTESSYEEREVPVVDEFGRDAGTQRMRVLRPLGERELKEIRYADGATFLKQIDIYRRLLAYYQYSWKNPVGRPIAFEPEEVTYFEMNPRTHDAYGYAPLQAVQQVVELLIQSTRWNKEFFKNNAMPDMMVGMPQLNPDQIKQVEKEWRDKFVGKAHKTGFYNTTMDFQELTKNSRDMEWLDGQKWFMHLIFGAYGVSPVEAGFHENVNQGNQAGQERITVKNAIKPYLTLIERRINREIIPEILQDEKPGFEFKFFPQDHVQEKIEFEQAMDEIDRGLLTPNEYRRRKGMEPIEGGDEPYRKPSDTSISINGASGQEPSAQGNPQAQGRPQTGADILEADSTPSPVGKGYKKKGAVPDNAVRISDRSEAPAGAAVSEGPRGGLYYVPGATEGSEDIADDDEYAEPELLPEDPASDIEIYEGRDAMDDAEPYANGQKPLTTESLRNLSDEFGGKVPENIQSTLDANFQAFADKKDTFHTVRDDNGDWTEERKGMHQEVFERYDASASEADANGRAVFMAGIPGAGKTYAVSNLGDSEFFREVDDPSHEGRLMLHEPTGEKFLVINSDDFKHMLPEYEGGLGAAYVHRESSYLKDNAINRYRDQKVNIIVDGTFSDPEDDSKAVDQFRESGYGEVSMVHVDTPAHLAMKRAWERFSRIASDDEDFSGRFTPFGIITAKRDGVRRSGAELQGNFDSYTRVDNSQFGNPQVVEQSGIELVGSGGTQ